MPKVTYKHLEDVTKFLDKISKTSIRTTVTQTSKNAKKAAKLSKTIKENYTEIKPHYE